MAALHITTLSNASVLPKWLCNSPTGELDARGAECGVTGFSIRSCPPGKTATGGAIPDQYRELSHRPVGRDEPEFENGASVQSWRALRDAPEGSSSVSDTGFEYKQLAPTIPELGLRVG